MNVKGILTLCESLSYRDNHGTEVMNNNHCIQNHCYNYITDGKMEE